MNAYQAKAGNLNQAVGVLMAFALVFPTALVNLALFLLLLSYFASGNYADKWQRIKSNPVARASLLLLGLFVLGATYTTVGFREAMTWLNLYRELIILPIVISLFRDECWRLRAYYAFFVAIGVAVLASFAMRLGWLPPGPPEQDWVPFKGRIAYGFFLAFAVYLMVHHAVLAEALKKRVLWLVFAALSTFDLFFLVTGRTGYVVFLALLGLFLYQQRSWVKKYWLLILPALAVFVTVVALTSPAIKGREGDIKVAEANPEQSSIGQRLIFWQTSLRIIADHPLLGGGTGSFAQEFTKHAGEHRDMHADNPHNEYLMIATQLGPVGLLGFLWLLYSQLKLSGQLPPLYGVAAQGLVVAMATGCLFNSFLKDHGEGHFFAIYAGLLFSAYIPRKEAG